MCWGCVCCRRLCVGGGCVCCRRFFSILGRFYVGREVVMYCIVGIVSVVML